MSGLQDAVEQAIRSAIKTSVATSWHFISTYSVSNFLIRLMGSKLFHADGRTDGRTDGQTDRHDEANS